MKTDIKLVLELLRENGDWLPSGQVARSIHEVSGGKESQIERRCRDLCKSGILEKRLKQVDNKGVWFCEYRYVESFELITQWRPTQEELKQNRLV